MAFVRHLEFKNLNFGRIIFALVTVSVSIHVFHLNRLIFTDNADSHNYFNS